MDRQHALRDSLPDKPLCRVLTGPTGSGKSDLALQLAEEQGWEILCMDSMQVYRRMNIGTAKPTREERKRVPHHLLDLIEPDGSFSVADYQALAEQTVLELTAAGKPVLFVGGTGLYLRAMRQTMTLGAAPADPELRERLHAMAQEPDGRDRIHRELEQLDPDTAARLHPNDLRRVIRAIEVCRITGIPFSRQPRTESENPFRWKVAATTMPREVLYGRINRRVDRMIQMGLKQEVEELLAGGVPESAQSMSGLGYKEMIPCVRGETGLEEAAEAIRLGTRHYAKRQMTFLRREEEICWVDASRPDALDCLRECLTKEEE